jgi:hypothetical protein
MLSTLLRHRPRHHDMYNKFEKGKGLSHEQQEKYAEIMRTMWVQENTVMGVRFTWFTTLQGLLLASLGFSWKERVVPFIIILCILGAIVSLSTWFVFRLGKLGRDELVQWWDDNLKGYKGPSMTGHIERKMTIARVFRPWRVLPPAFCLTWIATAFYALFFYRVDAPNKKLTFKLPKNQQTIISSQPNEKLPSVQRKSIQKSSTPSTSQPNTSKQGAE